MSEKTRKALSAIRDALDEHSTEISRTGNRVDKLEKIVEAQAREIAGLQAGVRELRNESIRTAIARGVATQVVADAHGLTSARISQIAPRKGRTPLC